MQPSTVLAELAPVGGDRLLDVTKGAQPLVWLADPERAPRRAETDRLAVRDARHREERILRRGWGFLAGPWRDERVRLTHERLVSLIPTDAKWQPTGEAAAEAEAYVRRVFTDPDGIQDVTVEFYDRITVVHAGENLQRITCPRCDRDIPLDWYGDLIEQTEGEFDSLNMTAPCCGMVVALDTLKFDWPSGFARFEIAVANPVRAEYEFTADEVGAIAAILGHPVRQILAQI